MRSLSNIFKTFSARLTLSTAIALVPTFHVQAHADVDSTAPIVLIPPGSTPSFLPQFYDAVRNALKDNAPDEAKISRRVEGFATIPKHPLLTRITSASQSEAERIARACGSTLCADQFEKLTPRDQIIAQLMVVQALFHNGLSVQDQKTYAKFVGRINPDSAFTKLKDERLVEIMTTMMRDKNLIESMQKWLPVDRITADNAVEQYRLRQTTMQRLSDITRAAFNLPPVEIIVDTLPDDINMAGVYVNPQDERNKDLLAFRTEPFILMNYKSGLMEKISQGMTILIHETDHSINDNFMTELKAGRMAQTDPAFVHTAISLLNYQAYLTACLIGDSSRKNCDQYMREYQAQYIERAANNFVTCAGAAQRYILSPSKDAPFVCTPSIK